MSTFEEATLLSDEIDKFHKSHGCLKNSAFKDNSTTPEDYLKNKSKWNPHFRPVKQSESHCTSTSFPFCSSMDTETCSRYSAQYIALHNFSKNSHSGSIHESISTSSVLVIGAGGLGSPLLLYLASSGVGVMDGDVVELSNLHRHLSTSLIYYRQIIHDETKVGVNKAKSAVDRLLKLNSLVKYIPYECYLGVKEAHEILPLYDVVVDASDNPQTKYLINDACILYNKPYVIASCIRVQGQLMVFNRLKADDKMPCFRCICPEEGNPSISFVKNACSSAGVLGSIPGVLGSIQATEVLKLCAGVFDSSLSPGRMILYDAQNSLNPFRTVQLSKNRHCQVCGDGVKDITLKMHEPVDIQFNLDRDHLAISPQEFWQIYMDKLQNGLPVFNTLTITESSIVPGNNGKSYLIHLLDVRPSAHYYISHLPGAINWPLNDILNCKTSPNQLLHKLNLANSVEWNSDGIIVLTICRKGRASRIAAETIRVMTSQIEGEILCFSVAGGVQNLRNMNLKMPCA